MELDSFRRFLAVEERRVHRAGGHGVDRDATVGELLGRRTGEVLHRGLAAGVGGVAVGEGGQQGSDHGDDLAIVGKMLACLLDEEVRSLGIDVEHRVVLVLGGLDDGLAQHLAGGVDGDVDLAERLLGLIEQGRDVLRCGQVALEDRTLDVFSLHSGEGVLGIRSTGIGIVVDRHVGSGSRGLARHQASEILAASGDQDVLSLERVLSHAVFPSRGLHG